MSNLLKSTGIVSSMTLISRILGFVRDMVIAILFGATPGSDAFFVAFKLPNFMRRLFAEGAFSQAFVPVLSHEKETKSEAEVRTFISHMTAVLGLTLLIFVVIAMLLAPFIVMVFAPGFVHHGLRFDLSVHMLRITFPYLFFISLVACAAAILNTYGRFAAAAVTPVILNVVLIVSAYIFYHAFAVPIYSLAVGVLIAGILQLIFIAPFLKARNLLVLPKPSLKDSNVRRVLALMVPAIVGVSVSQINLLVDTVFASFLKVGSVSWLYYSERLMNFPLGVFGVAVATVVLPHLSKKKAQADEAGFSKSVDWALRVLLLIGLPSSLGLLFLAGPLLSTLFQYGHFKAHSVVMARESLIAFALGVQFFMLVKVLASSFYARQDIKTPVKIAVVAMLLNVALNFALIMPLQHAGIALATTLSSVFNCILLFYYLLRKNYFKLQSGWARFWIQLIFSNVLLSAYLYFTDPALSLWLEASVSWRVGHLLLLVVPACAVYWLALRISGLKLLSFVK